MRDFEMNQHVFKEGGLFEDGDKQFFEKDLCVQGGLEYFKAIFENSYLEFRALC